MLTGLWCARARAHRRDVDTYVTGLCIKRREYLGFDRGFYSFIIPIWLLIDYWSCWRTSCNLVYKCGFNWKFIFLSDTWEKNFQSQRAVTVTEVAALHYIVHFFSSKLIILEAYKNREISLEWWSRIKLVPSKISCVTHARQWVKSYFRRWNFKTHTFFLYFYHLCCCCSTSRWERARILSTIHLP